MTPESANHATEDQDQRVVYVLQQQDPGPSEADIDLLALFRIVWHRKWWVVGITVVVTALAVTYALRATSWYRAEAVLILREAGAGAGRASGLGQLGGLAQIAGFGMGSSARQEPLGVLRSYGFSKRFIERNKLAEVLAGPKPNDIFRGDNAGNPDLRDYVETFRNSILTIDEDKKTGLVTVQIQWTNPVEAANWANGVSQQINAEMRSRALDEAQRNLRYLQEQLGRTETVSLQQGLAHLIETEMQKAMIARGTEQHAFRIIDEARPPLRRSSPKRRLIVVIALLASLGISSLGVILVEQIKKARDGSSTGDVPRL